METETEVVAGPSGEQMEEGLGKILENNCLIFFGRKMWKIGS